MSIELLQKRFGAMGARVTYTGPLWGGVPAVDVPRGRGTFVLGFPGGYPVGVEVVDVRRQHLLLLVRDVDVKSKFLCGHDERDWFVAAVPEAARGVTGVDAAIRRRCTSCARSRSRGVGAARRTCSRRHTAEAASSCMSTAPATRCRRRGGSSARRRSSDGTRDSR